MARHTAGHRMDGVRDLDAMALEQLAQIGELTLGLSLGQTETGDEDDLLRVHELHGNVVRGGLLHRALRALGRAGGGGAAAETAGEHAHQRAVHGLGHVDGQGHAGGADEGAGHDQGDVVDRQAAHGHGGAGAGIEHGDDHGHVGAADRDDEHQTVDQREHGGQDAEQQALLGHDAQHDERGEHQHDAHHADHALGRDGQLTHELQALQLAGGHQRAGEGDRTDQDAQTGGDQHHDGRQPLGGQDVVERHERGRAAAHGVEDGDQLRHVGHLDLLGRDHAGHGADDDADDQQRDGHAVLEAVGDLIDEQHDERHRAGQDHARGGDQVALAGGLRRVHQVQADHEDHGGDQIDEPFDHAQRRAQGLREGTHYLSSPFFFDLSDLNISSMRSVTT